MDATIAAAVPERPNVAEVFVQRLLHDLHCLLLGALLDWSWSLTPRAQVQRARGAAAAAAPPGGATGGWSWARVRATCRTHRQQTTAVHTYVSRHAAVEQLQHGFLRDQQQTIARQAITASGYDASCLVWGAEDSTAHTQPPMHPTSTHHTTTRSTPRTAHTTGVHTGGTRVPATTCLHGGHPCVIASCTSTHVTPRNALASTSELARCCKGSGAGHAEGHTASCTLLCCSVGGGSGRGCGPGQAVACGGWREDCWGVLAPARAGAGRLPLAAAACACLRASA